LSSEAQPVTNPALKSLIDKIGAAIDKIQATHEQYWPRPEGVVDEIFHYCDATGLHGIVTSKNLWASDIFSLNDSSEVEYARRVICDVLSRYDLLSSLKELFSLEGFLDTYKGWNTHVCCFSAGPDLLSQWRAYGAQGNGFAIGFSTELLKKERDGPMSFSVLPIVYSRGEQISAIRRLLIEILKIDELTDLAESNPMEVTVQIATALTYMMAPLKDPVFSDEREWRTVITQDVEDLLLFRPTRGAIVPYVKLPLKPECFTRIVQGPSSHKEFGERSLRKFLCKNGLDHVKVESSAIPLRSL
jgi:hypothetical protein